MTTRQKPKEITAESQVIFGTMMVILKWVAVAVAVTVTVIAVALRWGEDPKREDPKAGAKVPVSAPKVRRTTEECTETRRCSMEVLASGAVKRERLPVGRELCFDESAPNLMPLLGYKTSYRGEVEDPGCKASSCLADIFWFEPVEKDVPIPEFWLAPAGGRCYQKS